MADDLDQDPLPEILTVSKNPIVPKKIVPRTENPAIFQTPLPAPDVPEPDEDELPDLPPVVVSSSPRGRGRRGRGRPCGRGRARTTVPTSRPRRAGANYAPPPPGPSGVDSQVVEAIPACSQEVAEASTDHLEILFYGDELKKSSFIVQLIGISTDANVDNEFSLKLSDSRSWILAILTSSHSKHIKYVSFSTYFT